MTLLSIIASVKTARLLDSFGLTPRRLITRFGGGGHLGDGIGGDLLDLIFVNEGSHSSSDI